MPGSISLPQAVLDLEAEDRQRYQAMKPPETLVVRYAYTRRVAELPYDGPQKPGCGSKVVIRTDRGTELAEMLTTTCANAGCGKSVSRQQMLDYIEASGGKDFPFGASGKVLRLATAEDILEQQKLDSRKMEYLRLAKSEASRLNLVMRLVDVEMLLGGERIIFHYTSEQRVDFRELVRSLAAQLHTRIEMHQVSARDEARLVADFEKCGQHCCCRQFLKVLKPVSMRMAKVQKATLDPTKISGRCGRLMCCLRYEDETYESLKKRLPRKQTRMMTPDGPGTVIDGQILTQLALLRMDENQKIAAYPVESLQVIPKDSPLFRPPPPPAPPEHGSRGAGPRGQSSRPPAPPLSPPAPPSQPSEASQASQASSSSSRIPPASAAFRSESVDPSDSMASDRFDDTAAPLGSSPEFNPEDSFDDRQPGSDVTGEEPNRGGANRNSDPSMGPNTNPPHQAGERQGSGERRGRRRRGRGRRGGRGPRGENHGENPGDAGPAETAG